VDVLQRQLMSVVQRLNSWEYRCACSAEETRLNVLRSSIVSTELESTGWLPQLALFTSLSLLWSRQSPPAVESEILSVPRFVPALATLY
jgi:hypothetical protein